MKTIGMIGGMSWESTVTYYQLVNRVVKERLGGFHSCRCLLYSVDFHDFEACMRADDWDRVEQRLLAAARCLEAAGADFLVICTNTMHKVADTLRPALSVPLLHIAEVTAAELRESGVAKAGLLGTKYTMEQDFFTAKLRQNGVEAIVPGPEDRQRLNEIIFGELCLGVVSEKSRRYYLDVVDRLAREGAGGVILGCTEIGLLLKQEDTPVRLFDTTIIHATRAALAALE